MPNGLRIHLQDIAIPATNGIWTWKDVIKSIMVGASTVQIATAIMYSPRRYSVINEFINGLIEFMANKG